MRCTSCGRLPSEGHCDHCHAVADVNLDLVIEGMPMRKRRKNLGLSAEDLAAMIDTSPDSIYSWERGESHPRSRVMAKKWQEALGL